MATAFRGSTNRRYVTLLITFGLVSLHTRYALGQGNVSTRPVSSPSSRSSGSEAEIEYEPYDGWYNNRAAPDWGGIDTILVRRLPSAYSDGVYEPSGVNRPNPLAISEQVMNGSTGLKSYQNRSALLVFFGQQVVEEIMDVQRPGCPREFFNIPIPRGHPKYDRDSRGGREMPFLRTRFNQRTGLSPNNPRQQLNEITPYLDGGIIYGIAKAWADTLRSFKDGLLAAQNDTDSTKGYFPIINNIRLPFANPPPPRDHYLKPVNRFWRIGNARGNENPFLLTFAILWFRWHNHRARQLKLIHPNWNDEKLYNEARKWTIAVHQKIVVYDWLPAWLGKNGTNGDPFELPKYSGYKPAVHPGITHIFQTAAMRFGHTLVPPAVYRRDNKCNFKQSTINTGEAGHDALRLCNTYWNPQDAIRESDIDEILMGMASQVAEREDHIVVPDLRGDVFGPLEFSRRDLMALNIQRGRDHGMTDYNTARVELGLNRIENWGDINPELAGKDPDLFDRLRTLYNDNIDNVDVWVGGLLETTEQGPGELFRQVTLDAFERIRDGDRFWYENYKANKLFTAEEVAEIQTITLADVIIATNEKIGPGDIQKDVFFTDDHNCSQPAQLQVDRPNEPGFIRETCGEQQTFDYFSGSETSYIISLVILGLALIGTVVVLFTLAMWREKKTERQQLSVRRKSVQEGAAGRSKSLLTIEWVKPGEERQVRIRLNRKEKRISVKTELGKPLRGLDLKYAFQSQSKSITIFVSTDKKLRFLSVEAPKEIDLVLKFEGIMFRDKFLNTFKKFLGDLSLGCNIQYRTEKQLLANANTIERRQQLLEKFFRVVFSHAFKYSNSAEAFHDMDAKEAQQIVQCELTKTEFADALSLKPDATFVTSMFEYIDSNNNGYINFREFLDMLVIFSKGSPEDKARLLFDMYDLKKQGTMSREDFKHMLKSLMELANADTEEDKIDEVIESMFTSAHLDSKNELTFEDFNLLLREYEQDLQYTTLTFKDMPTQVKRDNAPTRARKTVMRNYRSDRDERYNTAGNRLSAAMNGSTTAQAETLQRKPLSNSAFQKKWNSLLRYVENYKRHIFWLVLYTLVVIGIFAERAYYYSVEREHAGLRRIAGYGVTVTRGAASAMMFTYSSMLVTMCRNGITLLRETFLHRFIPFDAAIAMHKYIAALALFFTVMHIIGHGINFYHISTQTASDLNCFFRNFFHATHELPKFHFWLWGTITGVTGVILTLLVMIIYLFALQYARRHVFSAFWFTHNMYILLYIFLVLHGIGRLVQPPFFQFFFIGPAFLFILDKLVSISRKKVEIAVIKAELLPSDVTYLEFKRPLNFEYKSGQWVRIACLTLGQGEYHPFTLTSAPHEDTLRLHIRAVGPWTRNLRKTYDPDVIREHAYPKLYLDGPFGEGHQDWYKFDVAVLVGGGIGVTPFASILKDLVNRSQVGAKINCKKVYFLWVTRTQKHFEWMTDIIREVEEKDINDLVSVHIFVTQFKEKFDIRTTMLYICERHFQKVSNRSLFTGLRSVTHFGRPDFNVFFENLQHEHADVDVFGVFSCGPPRMTHGVEKACVEINRKDQAAFVHHYENF